jgi:hypothetical protein
MNIVCRPVNVKKLYILRVKEHSDVKDRFYNVGSLKM